MRNAARDNAKITTDHPEIADRFNRVLANTVEALEESKLQYAFIGGIASGGLGRPRSTHDIDIFVRPEDSRLAVMALAKHGFKTEFTDPTWLYKGWQENILVDVIFKSKGEIYLDSEMYKRTIKANFHDLELRLVAPEDLVLIKALAHSEVTPGHWHDALALLSHAVIDWDYLLRRARMRAPRRVLSLLLYAQSSDVFVPKSAIDELYHAIFGESAGTSHGQGQMAQPHTAAHAAPPVAPPNPQPFVVTRPSLRVIPHKLDNYGIARLRESLAEDERTNELDIQIELMNGKLLLRGEVLNQERRAAVCQIARETFPSCEVENQIRICDFSEPSEAEEVQ
jgi:hypothetical protein